MTRSAALIVVALLAGCGGGGERLKGDALPAKPQRALEVSSPAFRDGGELPRAFTCDGAGKEPRIVVGRLPEGTRELALVVTDPDAPGGTFVHLTRYGLAPNGSGGPLPGSGKEGHNSGGDDGWTAACPPKGDGAHHYRFTVYALAKPTGLDAGAEPGDVIAALRKAGILAGGTTTARYGR